MNLSKTLILGTALAMTFVVNPSYSQDAKPAKITPAEIGSLATIAAIDKAEILVSVVAMNEKVNSDVKDLAKMMIDQHGDNLTQILQMANDLHIPLNGGSSDKIAAQSKNDLMKLGALQGDQFSKAYADAMVNGHQAALNLIDNQLMKTAKSEEIKKFLTDTRAVVAEHLEHAKKLQSELNS